MTDPQNQLNQLLAKLEFLLQRQDNFTKEINQLREEVIQLKKLEEMSSPDTALESEPKKQAQTIEENILSEKDYLDEKAPQYETTAATKKFIRNINDKVLGGVCSGLGSYASIDTVWVRIIWVILTLFSWGGGILIYALLWVIIPSDKTIQVRPSTPPRQGSQIQQEPVASKSGHPPIIKSNLEKFIGENLINKIGIAILVIGVGIGAKYSIENDLISPLTRILLGYLVGIGLLGLGMKLKKKYDNFSAVLVSGAMAILYFITYAAYSFYDLIPQTLAFVIMVIFTIFTVIAALNYNKQVIAHIGLVGAYAVPFLLSNETSRAAVLFSYVAILNIGILVIAFKKYWKLLYYVSFALTWLIFFSWYTTSFKESEHFTLAWTFVILFFAIFYTIFLAYKLVQKEKFEIQDIILVLLNSFIFYGIGYALLDNHEIGKQYLGLFTLGNAIIHFMVSVVIYLQKLADRNVFYLIAGLVLVFITIAIPVQLDGNWVTLLWAGEAALLFWIGRTKNTPIYEKLSYPLMIMAFISLLQDWGMAYNHYDFDAMSPSITPIINIHFLSSVLFIVAFWFINWINRNKNYTAVFGSNKELSRLVSMAIPALLLITIYLAFRMEIAYYWDQLQGEFTSANSYDNNDLKYFKNIWLIIYTMFFLFVLSIVNLKKLKINLLGFINLGLNALVLTVFLVQGLYELSELRESYIAGSQFYQGSFFNISIRYVSFVFVALLLISSYNYLRQEYIKKELKIISELVFHLTILWIISSELLHWMDLGEATQSYKLGLSILWGVYALLLIALGIYKKKKYLRIGAIAVFGITLLKLFFYDISHLETIPKTIVFISLGTLLLIISFLYNKYKDVMADDTEK